jgi:hypothetical protein
MATATVELQIETERSVPDMCAEIFNRLKSDLGASSSEILGMVNTLFMQIQIYSYDRPVAEDLLYSLEKVIEHPNSDLHAMESCFSIVSLYTRYNKDLTSNADFQGFMSVVLASKKAMESIPELSKPKYSGTGSGTPVSNLAIFVKNEMTKISLRK